MFQTPEYQPPKPLDKSFDREAFDCGADALNEYLKKFALQNQKKDAARTYVVADPDNRILGYYTLVFGSVAAETVPDEIASGLGRYPIPALLLARLAVHKSEKGKGLGGLLMRDVLLRAIQASDIAGLRAVMVHAKDESAKKFYQKIGFVAAPNDEFHLFLKISDIKASL